MERNERDYEKEVASKRAFYDGSCRHDHDNTCVCDGENVELRIDTDSITDHDAGRAFLPPLEIEDEDEGMMDLKIDTEELRDADPTIPYTVHFELHADDEIFDDDLKIRGTGIRQTYVDAVSVDNTQAWGRLLVYPFYRLPQPEEITVDYENRKVSWSEVPYAGDYEVVISYTKKNGDLKTVRKRTKHTSIGVGSEISASSTGTIFVSLRALATEEEGYVTAEIVNGVARWEAFSSAEKYRVCIQWNDSDGRLHKKEETTDKNWKGRQCVPQCSIQEKRDREGPGDPAAE